MKRKNMTRNALFTSIISLLLCVSMLVGTTFAWFTDEVISGTNMIAAGNLDVELYTDGGSTKVTNETKLFDNMSLWEPGVVAYENLQVKNAGNLALKYTLSVNATDATSTIYNGATYTLENVLKVAMIPGGVHSVNREEVLAAAKAADGVNLGVFAKSGKLLEGESTEVWGLVIYWEPGENDNIFNLNNDRKGEKLTINLGVNLFATQEMKEEDSFGKDYDKDSVYTDVIVANEAELVEALANAKDGDVIGIEGNVTWTTGAEIGSTPFIENVATISEEEVSPVRNITLLGIGSDATFTAIGSGVGAVGIDGGTVTFENLKIVDESVSYKENSWEFGYLEFRGNTVFENCDIVNAIFMQGESATFRNCSFNSNKDNEYAVWVYNGNAIFENCEFTGARGVKIHEAYGSEVDTVVINENTFVNLTEKPGVAIGDLNADTTVELTNNEFIGTQAGDQNKYSYETDTDVNTFNFTDSNNKIVSADEELPDGFYKIEEGKYSATNADGLKNGLANVVEPGDTIVLGGDITYTGNGYATITKDVTIDLNGNTLSTTSLGVVAKAGTIKNGTVANPVGGRAALRTWSGVSIENVTIESPENGGITVAEGNSLPCIKDVTINAKTYGIELQYGASVGEIENVNITAGTDGIVVQGGTIGKITNSVIKGNNAGIYGQLKGVNDLSIALDGTNEVRGANYGIYLCDEGANITTPGHATLNYSDDAIYGGEKIKLAFGQDGKVTVNGVCETANATSMDAALFNGNDVVMTGDMKFDANTTTANSGYGATGVSISGNTLDGNGNSLGINNWGTWDSAINITGGTIKNLTVNSGMRGIFINHNGDAGKVYLENVVVDGTIYTISCDQGTNSGLEATNSTFNGWTSYAATIGDVKFVDCSFGEGQGYNFSRPYAPTEYVGCKFAAGHQMDPRAAVTFENCTIGGVDLTAENLATLVTSNIANATVK